MQARIIVMNVYNITHVHAKLITMKFLIQGEALMVTVGRGIQYV